MPNQMNAAKPQMSTWHWWQADKGLFNLISWRGFQNPTQPPPPRHQEYFFRTPYAYSFRDPPPRIHKVDSPSFWANEPYLYTFGGGANPPFLYIFFHGPPPQYFPFWPPEYFKWTSPKEHFPFCPPNEVVLINLLSCSVNFWDCSIYLIFWH